MEKKAKDLYDMLLETGELDVAYSEFGFTGDWKEDKKVFLSVYEENIKAIKEIDNLILDLDDEDFLSDNL